MKWQTRIPRTINLRQSLVGIAFLALILSLVLQSWRASQRESQLQEQLYRTQYQLANTRHALHNERDYRDEYGPAQQARRTESSQPSSVAGTAPGETLVRGE